MSDESNSIPLADFQAEMERRGKLDCKFLCPQCGRASSPADFQRAGADLQRATSECIGRVSPERGCDWAAFGLLRGPVFVMLPDGHQVAAFKFADQPGS